MELRNGTLNEVYNLNYLYQTSMQFY